MLVIVSQYQDIERYLDFISDVNFTKHGSCGYFAHLACSADYGLHMTHPSFTLPNKSLIMLTN